ncbi:MAG: FHA domain-containing protein [Gemmatimonadales bacterium]
MIQLELGGHRWPLATGESVVGSSSAAAVHLVQAGVLERHALVHASRSGASIRPAGPDALVLVNGVRLSVDPVPLLHGDKLQIGEVQLLVVDDRQVGATRVADATALRAATEPGAPHIPSGPMSAGRLVSLSDGREYLVGPGSLVIGRDASCDVVIESTDVSRHHAVIANGPAGYVLEDTSANGVVVNGVRAGERRTLTRGDIVKIGPAEFRFYADAVEKGDAPPPGAVHRLYDTAHGIPSMVPSFPSRPTAPPPLATVLVRSGSLRGQRLPIRTPVINIGRADYNDLVFSDESVSASHAKLQRREALWVLTDLDSTNGTFVDGDQIRGEVPLMPGSTVRFGDVAVMFDPTDARGQQPVGGRTREVGSIAIPETPRMPVMRPGPPAEPGRPIRAPRPPTPESRIPAWGVVIVVLIAVAVAVAYYFFFGR